MANQKKTPSITEAVAAHVNNVNAERKIVLDALARMEDWAVALAEAAAEARSGLSR